MNDEQQDQLEVAEEFKNVPHDELQKYLADSGLRAGEDHDHWASRNRLAKEKLLAAYPSDKEE